MAQDYPLSRVVGREAIATLGAHGALETRAVLGRALSANNDIQPLLDQYYTDDGHGNGWLVLSSLASLEQYPYQTGDPVDRSHFWNLFSPLFNDRRAVAARFANLVDDLDTLADESLGAIQSHFTARGATVPRFTFLDGPVATSLGVGAEDYHLAFVLGGLQWRRAATVIVALSMYRYDHGEYPAELSALEPDYLAALPDDLLTAKPLIYVRTAPTEYRLGPNADEIAYDEATQIHRTVAGDRPIYNLQRPSVNEE